MYVHNALDRRQHLHYLITSNKNSQGIYVHVPFSVTKVYLHFNLVIFVRKNLATPYM